MVNFGHIMGLRPDPTRGFADPDRGLPAPLQHPEGATFEPFPLVPPNQNPGAGNDYEIQKLSNELSRKCIKLNMKAIPGKTISL